MKFIKQFRDIRLDDTPLVGGKNSSIGQMIAELGSQGIRIPDGFAVTVDAYWYVLEQNKLLPDLKKLMGAFTDPDDLPLLRKTGQQVRTLISNAQLPNDLREEIVAAYAVLCKQYGQSDCDVAVRSSATAEDLPTASFAGQQETFLNVRGNEALLHSCLKSMASLFTDRAIIYRMRHGFDHFAVALSTGVQKMVRADLGTSGVSFSLDTESGFKDVIVINATFGLGDTLVQGLIIPDEFYVHKPTLAKGFEPIVKKHLGSKKIKRVYADKGDRPVADVPVSPEQQCCFCLTDEQILEIARYTLAIDEYYSQLKGHWSPMDVEWAQDGIDGKIYIVQARPETVHALRTTTDTFKQYEFVDGDEHERAEKFLIKGQSIGRQIVSGVARVIQSVDQIDQLQEGDILVTHMTDPDWVPIMKKATGIITNSGGRTCHAAIVGRELGISVIVGTTDGTDKIKSGLTITMDCSHGKAGYVYRGAIPFREIEVQLGKLPKPPVPLMINMGTPDRAYDLSFLPVAGVGLARIEFIIANKIGVHPMACVQPEAITDDALRSQIEKRVGPYGTVCEFFISRLAQGVGTIAAAFYPRPVVVRFSDFKSNEYRNLLGGHYFELEEENPMIGFRGAARYNDERYAPAFALECEAIKRVREVMGLKNVRVMVPFIRTVPEAQQVLERMAKHGLERGKDGLEVIAMCEVPANVMCIEPLSELFDGFSIGSNDLTQTVLAIDRDSDILAPLFDERDPAVKAMMRMAIEGAKKAGRPISICGQAPSDYPELAQALVEWGIDSLSLNHDSVLSFLQSLND